MRKQEREVIEYKVKWFSLIILLVAVFTTSSYIYGSFVFLTIFLIVTMFVIRFKLTTKHGNNYRVIHLRTRQRVPSVLVMSFLTVILSGVFNKSFDQYRLEIAGPAIICSGDKINQKIGFGSSLIFRVLGWPFWATEKFVFETLDNEYFKNSTLFKGLTSKIIKTRISSEVSGLMGHNMSHLGKVDCENYLTTGNFLILETLLGLWYSGRMFWDFPILIPLVGIFGLGLYLCFVHKLKIF